MIGFMVVTPLKSTSASRLPASDDRGAAPAVRMMNRPRRGSVSFQELALIQVRFRKKLRNLRPFYDAQAKKRMEAGRPKEGKQKVAEVPVGQARSEAGRAAGVNHELR